MRSASRAELDAQPPDEKALLGRGPTPYRCSSTSRVERVCGFGRVSQEARTGAALFFGAGAFFSDTTWGAVVCRGHRERADGSFFDEDTLTMVRIRSSIECGTSSRLGGEQEVIESKKAVIIFSKRCASLCRTSSRRRSRGICVGIASSGSRRCHCLRGRIGMRRFARGHDVAGCSSSFRAPDRGRALRIGESSAPPLLSSCVPRGPSGRRGRWILLRRGWGLLLAGG